MKPAAADLCLVMAGVGRIRLQSSAVLGQLRVRIDWAEFKAESLNRASQLRKRFAKLRGRATDNSPKRAIEVRHGLKAAAKAASLIRELGLSKSVFDFSTRTLER